MKMVKLVVIISPLVGVIAAVPLKGGVEVVKLIVSYSFAISKFDNCTDTFKMYYVRV